LAIDAGDYNVVGGIPRGLLLYANYGVIFPACYWEVTIATMEDGQPLDAGLLTPQISLGFAPEAIQPEQRSNEPWKYAAGTVLITISGRIHHYKTQNPTDWETSRVEIENFKIKVGDTIGVGWEGISVVGNTSNASGAQQRLERTSQALQRPVTRHGFRPLNPAPPVPPPLPSPTPAFSDSSR
jgi:hypothetical protein